MSRDKIEKWDEVNGITAPERKLEAFLESTDFDDAVRGAVSIGGDSDTIAAIAGSVAEAFYPVPQEDLEIVRTILDPAIISVFERFDATFGAASGVAKSS